MGINVVLAFIEVGALLSAMLLILLVKASYLSGSDCAGASGATRAWSCPVSAAPD